MRTVGRGLQYLGLAVPPVAVALELAGRATLDLAGWQMLMMLVAAVCIFSIGRILEGYGGG